MGCYGLGVSRILQASVEVLSKDENIRWPSLIAPFQVCIIPQMVGIHLIVDNYDSFKKTKNRYS
jgi:prolyl-tRNA synthetase